MNKLTKHIAIPLLFCFIISALFILLSAQAGAQQNWPVGENSGEPATENDAKRVTGAQEGTESTGDDEYTPDGDILVNAWYNGTGADWVIEAGDSIYRGNQSIDMKGNRLVVQDGGRLKFENVTLINARSVNIESGGFLMLHEDGINDFSRSVSIESGLVEVRGALQVETSENPNKYVSFVSLRKGLQLFTSTSLEYVSISTARGSTEEKSVGILIPGTADVEIKSCNFVVSENSIGILVQGADPEIKDCEFNGNKLEGSTGIMLVDTPDMALEDNEFYKFTNHAIWAVNSQLSIFGNLFKEMEYTSGDENPDEYIIYSFGKEPDNAGTIVDDNEWLKVGSSGKLFMQTYNLTVTVRDRDTNELLEGAKVELVGYRADTNTEAYTNHRGEAYLDCTHYYVYGSATADNTHHATNDGEDPYTLSASLGGASTEEEFSTVGVDVNDPGVTLYLNQKNYDFEPRNLVVKTLFEGNAVVAGEEATMECQVNNNGNKDAIGVQVSFYLVETGRAEQLLGTDTINVVAGGSTGAELAFTLDRSHAGQDVDYKVLTNTDGAFTDADETNDYAVKMGEHVNGKPTVLIGGPLEGTVLYDITLLSGTVGDADGEGPAGVLVKIGGADWTPAVVEQDAWALGDWDAPLNGPLNIQVKALDRIAYTGSGDKLQGEPSQLNVTMKLPAQLSLALHPLYTDFSDSVWGNETSELTFKGDARPQGSNSIETLAVQIDDKDPVAVVHDNGEGSWEYLWGDLNTLPRDGTYTFSLRATDHAGVETVLARELTIFPDNPATDPELHIQTLSGHHITGSKVLVQGYVLEDYGLKAVEYSLDGTVWETVQDVVDLGDGNYSWTQEFTAAELGLEDEEDDIIVFFRAQDTQTLTQPAGLQIQGPVPVFDLFFVDGECVIRKADGTTLGENSGLLVGSTVTVHYTLHKDGGGVVKGVVLKILIGDTEVATQQMDVELSQTQESKIIRVDLAYLGEDDVTIRVVHENDSNQDNNEITISTGPVDPDDDPNEDPGGWFLPGYSGPATVGIITLGALAIFFRCRRSH